jgi:hypothetical protein
MRAAQVGRGVGRGPLYSLSSQVPSHHLTGSRAFATLEWPAVKSLPQQEKVVVFTKVRGDSLLLLALLSSHSPLPPPRHPHQSYCGFCRDLVERFDDANVPVKEVQLDKFGEARCGLGQRACTHLPRAFPLPNHPSSSSPPLRERQRHPRQAARGDEAGARPLYLHRRRPPRQCGDPRRPQAAGQHQGSPRQGRSCRQGGRILPDVRERKREEGVEKGCTRTTEKHTPLSTTDTEHTPRDVARPDLLRALLLGVLLLRRGGRRRRRRRRPLARRSTALGHEGHGRSRRGGRRPGAEADGLNRHGAGR